MTKKILCLPFLQLLNFSSFIAKAQDNATIMVDGKEITLLSKDLTPELLIKHKGQLVKALKDDPLSLANANDLVTNNRDIMISAVREKGVAV